MFNEKPSREEILAATQVNGCVKFLPRTHYQLNNNVERKRTELCYDSSTRNVAFSQLYE